MRYLDDNFEIQQRLVRISMIDDELDGDSLAREVLSVLVRTLQVEPNLVMLFIKDRAAVNGKAFCQLEVFF